MGISKWKHPDGCQSRLEKPAANGTRPLVAAITNNHIELAMSLLDKGADPNAADNFYKRTPLFAAVEMRNPDFTRETAPPVPDKRDQWI